MRILLAVALLVALPALAQSVVSDPVDARGTHCGVFLNALAKQTIAVTVEGTGKICKFDVSGLPNGSHTIRMTLIANDPIWGVQESPQSAPLAFVKPAAPATPAGVRLIP